MCVKNYVFYPFIVILFSACSVNDINDKSKRNEKWAWWIDAQSGKGKWIPLSNHPTWKNGAYTKFYFNGKPYEKGKISNGIRVDTTFYFNQAGEMFHYRLNTKDSAQYYLHDGYTVVLRKDSSIEAEGIIQNHQIGGKWIEYYKNGVMKRQYDLKNDTGWIVNYYGNGHVSDSSFELGNTVYPVKSWFPSGNISLLCGWANLKYSGEYNEYFDNGQMKQTIIFVDGKMEGKGKYWFESGQLNGTVSYTHGIKDGEQSGYYPNGQVQFIANMKNGMLDGEQKAFDENGKMLAHTFFNDGVKIK